MQKPSKLLFLINLLFFLNVLCLISAGRTAQTKAQDAIPQVGLSCGETADNEFHSIRPYQAAPCGEAPLAKFCSNKLVIFEEFDLANRCQAYKSNCQDCFVTCSPNFHVEAHDLNITLDKSDFSIMGNTEDEFDDATKLNEYASWYLNGVIDKKENKNPTDEQVVNFSGPVRKLLPAMIQDAQKIKIIRSIDITKSFVNEETGKTVNDAENHDQIVVDNERLSSWKGDLSFVRATTNSLGNAVTGTLLGGVVTNGLNAIGVDVSTGDAWNKKTPPLPWDDGTVEFDPKNPDKPAVPFKSQILYQKAYNEWLGKSCMILPIVGLQCIENILIPNKYAELWNFVPLSNNSDKRGKNYLLTGDGPNYVPYSGTDIANAGHVSYLNAPLYFAHTQEVKDLSDLLNSTYQPEGVKSEPLPATTEQIKKGTGPLPTTLSPDKQQPASSNPYDYLDCSAVNVRVNKGDNLFPGDRPNKPDDKELYVEGAEYDITQVECHEVNKQITFFDEVTRKQRTRWERSFECPAGVGIEFKLGTQTPYANEIFKQTVADSSSTFRKIFPKVGEGAPVECIADIPTTTSVTYDKNNNINESPNGGTQLELKQVKYPADSGGSGTELTFPHIGSVYEYFLKGIQTALRPKGYGEPIANGNCKPTEPAVCAAWETRLGGSGGSCGICNAPIGELAKKILTAAGQAYNVPAANIWAAMKHEGADWDSFKGQFTDENVRKWSMSIECGGEPMPGCDPSDKSSSKTYAPFGFLPYWFYKGDGDGALWSAVSKFEPSRNSIDSVSHCNFLDATFAAAKSLATWSGFARTPSFCYKLNLGMSDRPASCGDWKDYNIVQSHVGYWIGATPWCPDGSGGPIPAGLGSNVAIPDYASRVLSDFKSAKCN